MVVPIERKRRSPRRFLPARRSRRLPAKRPSQPKTSPKAPKTPPKPKNPHVKTVATKDGKQVQVDQSKAYVSSNIPKGAVPVSKQGSGGVGVPAPASPPSPKVQQSVQAWGQTFGSRVVKINQHKKLPGQNSGTGNLQGDKTKSLANTGTKLKDTHPYNQKPETPKVDALKPSKGAASSTSSQGQNPSKTSTNSGQRSPVKNLLRTSTETSGAAKSKSAR